MLIVDKLMDDNRARKFCEAFVESKDRSKFIFGRTKHAMSISNFIDVDGFIDEFTDEKEFLDKPIIKIEDIPKDSLVVSVVIGRPLTVKKRLDKTGLEHLDYFSFARYCNLPIEPVTCWNHFNSDFLLNRDKYDGLLDVFADEESRRIYKAIINFRLSGNLKYMEGFTDQQEKQYFEEFLGLSQYGEVFVDVGGFDGVTSMNFIKRCPDYKAIHFFEPDKNNMSTAMEKLAKLPSIFYYNLGLSDRKAVVNFAINGSCSNISECGNVQIETEKLDNVLHEYVSYIKMDIEGTETKALYGARNTITKWKPRLAVSVYHKGDDMWRIPQQILSYYNNYNIYLRHYTEGVDETVMFFVPR